ncbi:MAG TPA: DUF2950 domain-containing protein [Methylomirabilota bacterium]|jgi:hypothetical protein
MILVRIALAVVLLWASGSSAATATHTRFPSPEAAVAALVQAVRASDGATLLGVLGPDARALIASGDEVADRQSRERFVRAYDEAHRLVEVRPGRLVLTVGTDEWPMPIPLVQDASGWWFDTSQGREEILNRRIGRNELNAVQVCLAYVDAQREYYVRDPDGDTLLQYAQRFRSTPGKRDGLYWEAPPGEPPSPLGVLVARAEAEGYPVKRPAGPRIPYWGYYYRIVKAQGAHAAGGAYDYLVRGQMIGGFALVAYPAEYGASGVMTFIVNHDGIVYQKDLGPNTSATARAVTRFDPDPTWSRF